MKIEEIQKLSNEGLGKELAWQITGVSKCRMYKTGEHFRIVFPNMVDVPVAMLCENLDIIRTVENIVIEKGLGVDYLGWLNVTVGNESALLTRSTMIPLVVADARFRAEACLLALQEKR